MSMKLQKNSGLDIEALETCLLNVHDLSIFNKNQKARIYILYDKFTKRIKVPVNHGLIDHLKSKDDKLKEFAK